MQRDRVAGAERVREDELLSAARRMVDAVDDGWWPEHVLAQMRQFFVRQIRWVRVLGDGDRGRVEEGLERIFSEGIARVDRRLGSEAQAAD